ncbi:MAG: polymerase subunit delta [Verrucomicrobiales bacterium]|nr:polymerase subunit delta [Verrucomicrobiales bacterium]
MAKASSEAVIPLVLFAGDDDFAVKRRAKETFQKWSAEVGGFDHELVDGAASNSGEALRSLGRLREALQTLPFFGGGKVIWFQNCNFLGDERTANAAAVTENLADLAVILKSFDWSNVRLIISAGKVDKRKTFYKTIDKLGTVEHFAGWSADDRNWMAEAESAAARQLGSLQKQITDEALARLVADVGPHNRMLGNEVEKLALFVGNRPGITTEDVNAIVSKNKQARAFALADALGARDLPKLLKTLDEELWELKTDSSKSEIGLLYGLISKVRAMIFLKEMARAGWIKAGVDYAKFKSQLEKLPGDAFPADKKYNPAGMHPFVLFNSMGHAQKYTIDELVRAMGLLLECNLKMVSSSLDEALVLQQTLVKIVQESDLK